MNKIDYIAAIKKQQRLIRRLIVSRRKRSGAINGIVQERYAHLIGKYFRRDDTVCRIVKVSCNSNYIFENRVDVYLHYDYICPSYNFTDAGDEDVCSVEISNLQVREKEYSFTDIEENLISEDEAREYFDKLVGELKQNFGL